MHQLRWRDPCVAWVRYCKTFFAATDRPLNNDYTLKFYLRYKIEFPPTNWQLLGILFSKATRRFYSIDPLTSCQRRRFGFRFWTRWSGIDFRRIGFELNEDASAHGALWKIFKENHCSSTSAHGKRGSRWLIIFTPVINLDLFIGSEKLFSWTKKWNLKAKYLNKSLDVEYAHSYYTADGRRLLLFRINRNIVYLDFYLDK